ncbi:MAG TPA: thymidylate synthase [Candidatus Saccharimonadales bacterium]|nr:thymidylate synthase [Candidatus Saccharimonadales bacterium]
MIENWPLYFKDKLIVGNLDSNVGVATLWMPKESVAAELKSDSYSVCGQLYTKRGLNPMFRNILANPLIRYLVLCGVDRQGSGEALKRFFENGVSEHAGAGGELEGWKIIGDDEALLDKELTKEAFELIRKNVEFHDLRMKPLAEVAALVSSLEKKEAFGEPQTFAEAVAPAVNRFPTDMSVFKIRRDYIGDAWLDVLKILNKFGAEIPGLYGQVKEVHNLSVVIEKEDPTNPKVPEYMKFGAEGLENYYKGFFNKNEAADEVYTYGERIFAWDGIDQAQIMKDKLKKYPYDRGAMAVLWKPHKDNFPPVAGDVNTLGQTKGWRVPCLVMILGQCIDDNFNMTAVFRNNDMYGAWPLNAFALRKFQQDIAQYIGKNLGSLTTTSHIAEMYQIDWDDSIKIVEKFDSLDRTCAYDPRCYYTIKVENEDIVVSFFSPDGATQLAEYKENGKKPKVARDLCAMAIRDMLLSELGAAMDFGRQLAKAESAVKLGLKFEQDQPLKTQD